MGFVPFTRAINLFTFLQKATYATDQLKVGNARFGPGGPLTLLRFGSFGSGDKATPYPPAGRVASLPAAGALAMRAGHVCFFSSKLSPYTSPSSFLVR